MAIDCVEWVWKIRARKCPVVVAMSARLPPGGGLVLSRFECRLLAAASGAILRFYRGRGLATSRLGALLADLQAAASDPGVTDSEKVPTFDTGDGSGDSERDRWLATRDVAGRLGVSTRRVVVLVHEGRISGQQRDTKSVWRISEQSVAAYEASRDGWTGRRAS
jgi:hypothetical protein